MAEYNWRGWSRVIAWIHLILCGIAIVIFSIAVFQFLSNPDAAMKKAKVSAKDKTLATALVGVVLIAFDAIAAIQFWGGLKLKQATEENEPPARALENVQIWLNINVVLFMISLIFNLLNGSLSTIVINNGIEAVCIYIVYNFMQELKSS